MERDRRVSITTARTTAADFAAAVEVAAVAGD